jgi:hypothetical protein
VSSELRAEPRYDVVWPKSPRGVQARPLAPRLGDLAGSRIGFLWDYMFRGDELFPVIASELQARYAGVEVVGYDAFGNVHGLFPIGIGQGNAKLLAAPTPDCVGVFYVLADDIAQADKYFIADEMPKFKASSKGSWNWCLSSKERMSKSSTPATAMLSCLVR